MSGNTIILIRHGETSFNKEGIIQGNTDFPILTEEGRKQMLRVGVWLKELDVDCIYSSHLNRTKESAEIIASQCGVKLSALKIDKRLEEIDFGCWHGQQRKNITENYPAIYQQWRTRPYDFELENRYPVRELYDKISSFIKEEILYNDKKGVKVIVAHKGSILAIVSILLKLPRSHHHILQLDNGSVSVIQERSNTKTSNDYELSFTNEVPIICNGTLIDFKTEERTKSYGELFLVRHGQTDSNLERKYQGSMDIPLSEFGIKNMNLLAKSFAPNIPTRIICSPLSRAIQSAEIIANNNKIKSVSVRNDLHEFLYGIWEGMTEDEVSRYRHAEYDQWQTIPQKANIPQSEHINNAYNRCYNIWEDYQKDLFSWGGSIISVAHDIVNRLIICNALDLPANYIWSFKQTNASVSILAIKNVYDGRLRMLNHSRSSIKSRLSDECL